MCIFQVIIPFFEQVGLLDVDLCGPSVPYLLQLEGKDVHQCPEG